MNFFIKSVLLLVFFISLSGCNKKNESLTTQQLKLITNFRESVNTRLMYNNPDSAFSLAQKTVDLAYEVGNDTLLYDALNNLGIMYKDRLMIDSANNIFNQSLELAYKLNDSTYIAQVLHSQANTLMRASKYKLAAKKIREAMAINELTNNEELLAANYSTLGTCYYIEEKYDSAIICLNITRQFSEINKKYRNMAAVLNILSAAYAGLDLYDMAIKALKQAIHINDSVVNIDGLSSNLNNMGAIFSAAKNHDSAIVYFQKAIELEQQMNDDYAVTIRRQNLGNEYALTGNYDEARNVLNLAFNWYLENDRINGQITSLMMLANNEAINNSKYKAIDYYKRALRLSEKEKEIYHKRDILLNLGQLVMNINNTDTIDYLDEYRIIDDSIRAQDTRNKIIELETVYETKKKESEILLLRKTNQLNKTQLLLLISIVILLIITTFFITIIYKKRRIAMEQKYLLEAEKNKTQQLLLVQAENEVKIKAEETEKAILKLKIRDQEIIYHSLSNAKLTNAFNDVIERLYYFNAKINGMGDRKKFQEVLQEMKTVTKANPLEEFEKLFSNVYPGFSSKILQKYPDLTPRELHFCAFIKLNMQTKDMAVITNLSVKSLETSRYRIRKKMGLSTNQNLTTELMKL